MVGNKNMVETGVMIFGYAGMIQIFWVYGAPIYEDRKEVWEMLKRKVVRCEGLIMCVGDFNDVISEMEKKGGRRKEKKKIECFQEMINSCGLNDAHYKGQKFTWYGIREGELIKERLDKALVNLEWMEAFSNM